MKKRYLFFLVTCLITTASFAYCQDADFRNARWGMTREEVMKTEKKKPVVNETDQIGYEDTVNGLPCLIGYKFAEDKLTSAIIGFIQTHTNKNDFIDDYENLKQLLIKKYGNPKNKDDSFWKNDLYRKDYQDWGFAISLGHLLYITEWETINTLITMNLKGENFKIFFAVFYKSKQYKDLEEKQKNNESLEGL